MGLIGRRHADLVRTGRRSALAALVDPEPGIARLAGEVGVSCWSSLDDMLVRDRPDGAIIATPNAMHVSQALQCIQAGIPVLVEKPIATTVADGLRLANAAERAGVPLLVGHHRRHSPLLAAARDIVAEGRLGTVVAVLVTTMFAKPLEYFEAAPWRREPGGGPVLINLIHDVDALRALAGDVVRVQAVASNRVRRSPVEETVAVALEFANGAVGSMLLSDAGASPMSWEMTAGEDPVFPQYSDRDCYLVTGTQGSLGIPTMRLTVADGAPSWHRPLATSVARPEPADPLLRQLEHFCDLIAKGGEPLVGGRDAAESLRVTLAIGEAARTGLAVGCAPASGLGSDGQS